MRTVEPLARLPPHYGAMLSLVHQHGWCYDRIAAYVGLRREVVARLVYEAREALLTERNEMLRKTQGDRRREAALQRYIEAFDRGDLAALAQVLVAAEQDPELCRQIQEVNAALHDEAGLGRQEGGKHHGA